MPLTAGVTVTGDADARCVQGGSSASSLRRRRRPPTSSSCGCGRTPVMCRPLTWSATS